MTDERVREIAQKAMPKIEPQLVPGSYRWNVIDGLQGSANVGIELGVAGGSFSTRMVASGKFERFFGVDFYEDGHNIQQYKLALSTVGLDRNFHLLRMRFDEAIDLFPDRHFDFIYSDGFAHTGEEGGRTLLDWYVKLKPGGIMAGDDYDPDAWPLVVWAVHNLVAQVGATLMITDQTLTHQYNIYRSWFIVKGEGPEPDLTSCDNLVELGEEMKLKRIKRRQNGPKGRKQGPKGPRFARAAD